MRKIKEIGSAEILELFKLLPSSQQMLLFSELKKLMDEKEAERKQLSQDYQKLNGK